jgi:predicted CXXCH cytochrome family protein
MSHRMRLAVRIQLLAGLILFVSGIAMFTAAQEQPTAEATAAPETAAPQTEQPAPPSGEGLVPSESYCLLCHAQPDRVWTLPSGETLSLTVDPAVIHDSVHGLSNPEGPLSCIDCHTEQFFPHPEPTADNIREFQIERYATCRNCHEEQYTSSMDSVHGAAITAGHLDAATCVDCHGGHDIQEPDASRQQISLTCGKCHGAVFEQYQNSVHGSALFAESNPDVPTCIDCHGVHDITDPKTNLFRVRSPQLCATCHADTELMAKYDITPNVFDSYLTDFHGSTVALFEQQDPNVPTNKAVCFDCHGVHDIARVDAETSRVVRENLVTTCQECHPGATADFPASWVGHFPPTLESHPLLFLVDLFYKLLIPAVIGAFILLVLTDIIRRIRGWSGRRTQAES